ncbi:MAG: Gfo/Idh/MocA family protein [Opitutaceae bacterium]
MKTIRLGFIGAGWVARERHLPGLRNVEAIDIARVWSRNTATAESFAGLCGATTAGSWEEVAEARDVDAVVIATPPELHEPATIRALAAGKHVLCQARMARNLRESLSMVQAAAACDRVTALYPPKPGLKGDRMMRRLLRDENFVGAIREVRVTALAARPDGDAYRWASDPKVVGVNAMVMGMWVEILNRWVGRARRVTATAKCHLPTRLARDGARVAAVVPDTIVVAADLECGAVGSYHFSVCAASGPGHQIEIFGSDGALAYRLFSDEVLGAKNGGEWCPLEIPADEVRTQTTDAEFVGAIRGGPRVEPGFLDGIAYMEFCEAVAYSALRGTAVNLPLDGPLMEAWQQPVALKNSEASLA